MREYLLHCATCNEYTSLGEYSSKTKQFEGEYSLLHNRHTNNDELLNRFLQKHIGHALKAAVSRTGMFGEIVKTGKRFMDGELDKFVEEAIQKQAEEERDAAFDRALGQLQLNVLGNMLREEVREVSRRHGSTSAETQFLLGKEEGLKRALAILNELMEKTNSLYK